MARFFHKLNISQIPARLHILSSSVFLCLSSFCGAPSIERTRASAPPPRSSSSSSRRRAHHLCLRAAALIIFIFASPRHNLFSGPANSIATQQSFSGPVNPIAVPHSFQLASESHRPATIFSAGRKISSSPFCNIFSGLANPIVSGGRRFPSLSRQTSSQPAHHRRACCITAIQSKKPHYH